MEEPPGDLEVEGDRVQSDDETLESKMENCEVLGFVDFGEEVVEEEKVMDMVVGVSGVDDVQKEVDAYKKVDPKDSGPGKAIPDMNFDPLDFWKSNEGTFPILSRVARKYLAIHASSAAVERMFSYTGHRVSKKHANLHDDTILSMMLTRSFAKFIKEWEHVLGGN